MSAPPAELTVVIPCYNERGNVAPLAARLEAALQGIAWEAIYVDDNSGDGTASEARRLAAENPRIRCIRRIGRRGLSSACVEGMLASSSTYVAVIDGDLQHDETILPAMLEAVKSGRADIAVGSRYVPGGTSQGGFSGARQAISDAGGALARLALRRDLADPMSGFFLLPRATVDEIAPRLSQEGFKILLDILLTLPRSARLAEVPYAFRPRHSGESKLSAQVLFAFGLLLLDKALKGVVPARFVAFAAVGALGVLVHLAVLYAAREFFGFGFEAAQWAATYVAMTGNFAVNNLLTFGDRPLKGAKILTGLLLWTAICSVGAVANVGIATALHNDRFGWGLAGAAGAIITVAWNYAVSARLVWRMR